LFNRGVTFAVDTLLRHSDSEFVGILDDDDYLARDCLGSCLTAAIHQGADLVYTKYYDLFPDGSLVSGRRNNIEYSPLRLLVDNCLFHFRLIRLAKIQEVGGVNLAFPVAYDYDLMLRLSAICRIFHLPEHLYYYRVHPESISQKRRVEQAYYSFLAADSAIHRFGFESDYEIFFNYSFSLYQKGS
jgi:glycosyltransferase involved in cell wall biosynthesis